MKLRLLSMFTAMLLVLALVACSSSKEEVKEGDQPKTDDTVATDTTGDTSADRNMAVPDTTAVSNAIKDADKVMFALDSATLSADAKKALDTQAEVFTKFPAVKITLEGHADKVGGSEHNMKLSEKRAKSVKEYLVKKGVAGDRITAVGLGQDQDMRAVVTKVGM